MSDLLDQYAQAALTGFCANHCFAGKPEEAQAQRVRMAWEIARAMLDARDAAFLKGREGRK